MPPRQIRRGISLDRTGKWRVRVSYQGTQYNVGSYEKYAHAEMALDVARGEIASKTFVPPIVEKKLRKDQKLLDAANRITFEQWAERWLNILEVAGRSPGTIMSYRSSLKVHILPVIGWKALSRVTEKDISLVLAPIDAPGARQNAYRTLRACFAAAVKSRDITLADSPVSDDLHAVAKIKKSARLDHEKVLNADQLEALQQAMPEHLQVSVALAGWCALRLGEVLGLQRRDFRNLDDPDRASVRIDRQWHSKLSPPGYAAPKAGSDREVSIPPRIVPLIVAHLAEFVDDDPQSPILPSVEDPSRPVSQTYFDRYWRAARETVRPGFRFHDLRHTGLTKYAQTGATLKEIMQRAGHKDEKTALMYQHADLERDHHNAGRM
jgi:integrase